MSTENQLQQNVNGMNYNAKIYSICLGQMMQLMLLEER